MYLSRFFLATLKEAPAEAELVSHKLMLRAGIINKLGSGLYTLMPIGLRTYLKVENIIREEMDRSGAIELRMPLVNPAELWQETGRWEKFGAQLLKIKDRHDRDFLFAPTHEEVITDIVRREVRSYRQLPVNFYHITNKFRDEIRPRFGVMRAREFVMKDAYSFDIDEAGMMNSYKIMFDAYMRIFARLGLEFRPVAADTGAIGGKASQEFQVLADSGEDVIAYCPDSDFAANVELAEAVAPTAPRAAPAQPMQKVPTPGKSACEDVAAFLKLPLERTVKCLMLFADEKVQMLLVRGDHSLNEVKANKLAGFNEWRWATEEEIISATGCKPGYLGPVGFKGPVIADRTVAAMSDFICGANEADHHLTGVNWARDCAEPALVADLRNVVEGDASPDGKGKLKLRRGIEVGHVFALGNRYSKDMTCVYTAEDGTQKLMEMGCYGIGVTRIIAAAIEQNHDERGIIWPDSMAPFRIALAPIGYKKSEAVKALADKLHDELMAAGIDVLLDDRDERPGVMFADLELIGVPHRITIGDRGLKEGLVEYQGRRETAPTKVAVAEISAFLKTRLAA
jgi:prolyl-tRNA synthetase